MIHAQGDAQGIASGNEFADKGLVNEDDDGGAAVVLGKEAAALEQMNPAGADEGGADDGVEGRIVFVKGAAADVGGAIHGKAVVRERDRGLHGGGVDTGQGLKALEQAGIGLAQNGGRQMGVQGHEDEGGDVVGIEAEGDLLEGAEGADKEAAGDEENAGEGDLQGDQKAGDTIARGCGAQAAGGDGSAANAEGGGKGSQQAGDDGQQGHGSEDGRVYGDFSEAGELLAVGGTDGGGGGEGKGTADGGAGKRDNEAFNEELLEQAGKAGAEGGADLHFREAFSGPGNLQVGGIGAGNEQEDDNAAEESEQGLVESAGDEAGKRLHDEVPGLDAVVVMGGEEGSRLGERLGDGDAGFHPRKHESCAHEERARLLRIEGDGCIDHGPAGAEGELEAAGKDADDGAAFAGEPECGTEDMGIAVEAIVPEVMADEDNGRGGILRSEQATFLGLDAEHGKEIGGDFGEQGPAHTVGRADRFDRAGVPGYAREGASMAAQGFDLVVAEFSLGAFLSGFAVDHDELVGMGEGDGAEQDGVNDSEHGGDGAEAESKGEDDGGGIAWGAAEAAQGEAEILKDVFEPEEGALIAVRLLSLLDAAEGAAGGGVRFCGREAAALVVLFKKGEVESDFAVEVRVGVVGAAETAEASEGTAQEGAEDGRPASGLLRQQTVENARHLAPAVGFFLESFEAGFGDGVVLGLAIVFGGAPVGVDPAILLEAQQGGVEGALVDAEQIAGDLLKASGNGVGVAGTEGGEGAQDHEIERSLENGDGRLLLHWNTK